MSSITAYVQNDEMQKLLESSGDLGGPKAGGLVDGKVIFIGKNKILVDLEGFSTGIITGQEAHDSAGTVKNINLGDIVSAYVLEEENEDGLVMLSLRKASQEKTWHRFVDSYENGKTIQVSPNEANKGGLLLNIDGIKGFIPVSQLAPLHYPRVNGADSGQILSRLQKLVGKQLNVKIINLDRDGGKLILSERAAEATEREGSLVKLKIGDKVKGKISGIVKFGIFVAFEGLEGLVHISEIAWGHVKDPNDFGKLGDEVEVLVIGKDDDKISLSMKKLTPDPWVEATEKYQVGKLIKGEVTRITPFGAFVKLDKDINGLIHVSEISEQEDVDPSQFLKIGETVEAKIIAIDTEEHRVALSLKPAQEAEDTQKKKVKKDKPEKQEPVEVPEVTENSD